MSEPEGEDGDAQAGDAPRQGDVAQPMAGAVVVGVHRGQSITGLEAAARLADELGRPLLCGYVGEDTYLTEWDKPDAVAEESLHPTAVGAGDGEAALALSAAIGEALDQVGDDSSRPNWALRLLGGDPAKALARLASEVDARLIVVGTRRRGMASALEDRLAGSVAARLAHDQLTPVVVVPVNTKDRGPGTLA